MSYFPPILRWLPQFTPVTDFSKLPGIHLIAALSQRKIFRGWGRSLKRVHFQAGDRMAETALQQRTRFGAFRPGNRAAGAEHAA
ncbi:hypothetical protein ABIA51_003295 [Erwinia aphidicola]